MGAVPTVFVVDDNKGIRQSLEALFESVGLAVETYPSGERYLEAYDPERPGCLVLDVRLGESSGLDLQDELRRREARIPIIVVTAYSNVPISVRAMKGGALDFLKKPVEPTTLLDRVREAIEIDRKRREEWEARANVTARARRLTPREREVMDLLLSGRTSREIAAKLGLSVRTVEGHRRVVLRKMEVSSGTQLVRAVLKP